MLHWWFEGSNIIGKKFDLLTVSFFKFYIISISYYLLELELNLNLN